MDSANITRAEARDRAAGIVVESYEVHLDLTRGAATFGSTTTVRFTARTTSTWLDLIAPAVVGIAVNGAEVPADYDGARIPLDGLRTDGTTNEVTVVADCAYMNTGEGLHRFVDPVDDEVYLYTQFETADARRMYACFEQPDLKATFQLSVTAPAHWQVVSNAATPDPHPITTGVARWDFAATVRLSTYITALVAGPYHVVRDSYAGAGGTYPLGVFCRNSLADHLDSDEILTVTKQGFAFFESVFGLPYPFGKYDQLFVPEFNAGAMENAGCVTFLEDYVFRSRVTRSAYEQRANTILHELAHMWFGNLVTMKWWDDLWLNESFAEWAATFAAVGATSYTDAWNSFSILRKAWAYRQDQLPSTHPIAADMVDLDSVRVNFDGITYAKGASALKQLVAWVGEDEFLAGLRAYFAEFAWRNTELPDLLHHLEAASGRDLSDWTWQWLRTSGVNLLRPEVSVAPDGTYAGVAVLQEPPASPPGLEPVLRDHRIGVGLYSLVGDRLARTRHIEVDVRGARTDVPELTGEPQADLLLLNDDDYTFAKIRLDERSLNTAMRSLAALDDNLARTLVWAAVWDMVRDAEISVGEFLQVVLAGLPGEADVAVVQTILRQVQAAIDQYAAPANRAHYQQRLASDMWRSAASAPAGSDHQLAYLRAFAAVARSGADLDILTDLLSGDRELPGLVVDTDLRWTLVTALAAAGRDADELIAAELAHDATATGRRRAAAARAARPTAAAKQEAWDLVLDPATPNAILEATLGGFAQPGQQDLLAGFRDRYFDQVPAIWSARTPEMAQTITTLLYPFLLVDDETVAAADRLVARDDMPAAARRLVSEGRDGTLRALRAQQRDATP